MGRHFLHFFGQIVMFMTGVISYTIIALLAYQTHLSATGNEGYCSLWTDIPGRASIFLISFYIAGICGCFPLPDSWRLQCLPKPFAWCNSQTWETLIGTCSDRCFAMRMRTVVDIQGSSCTSTVFNTGESDYEERRIIIAEMPPYGATQPIPIPNNYTRRYHWRNFSTFASSEYGSSTSSNQISPYVSIPVAKRLKLSPVDSGCILPSRRSFRRKRRLTDSSSNESLNDERISAARSPDSMIFHMSLDNSSSDSTSSCSDPIAESPQNAIDQRMQHIDEEANVESVRSLEFSQLHLPIGNSSPNLSSSATDDTAERPQNINEQRMQHIDEYVEEEHASSPDSMKSSDNQR